MNTNISANELDFAKHFVVDIRETAEIKSLALNGAEVFSIDFHNADENAVLEYFRGLKLGSKCLVLMCYSGARSQMLCQYLASKGIAACNLDGGIAALCHTHPDKIIRQ